RRRRPHPSESLRDAGGLQRMRHVLAGCFAANARARKKRGGSGKVQRGARGKTLLGLESSKGSKAQRTRCIVSRSGSLYIFDIIFFLSSPTPCSPVIDPPAAMHNSKILLESISATSSCPEILRSYKTSGCKFPSPA